MLRAVAVLALVLAAVPSRPPFPTPAKTAQDQLNHSQDEQTKTSGNKKNAEPPTPSVDQTKTEVALRNQTQPEKQSQSAPPQQQPVEIWPEATAIAVAIATIVLAGLAIWQSHLMRKGLAETAKAADAAKLAADVAEQTLKITGRAYLIVRNFVVTGVSTTPEFRATGYSDAIGVRFEIANIGHTHATVTDAIACITLEELRAIPDYSSENRSGVIVPLTIAPNDKVEVTIPLSDDETRRVVRDTALSVFGRISYLDIFGGKPHPLRFARERSGVFVPARGGHNTALPMARVLISGYEESN